MEEEEFFEELYRNTQPALLEYLKKLKGAESWAEDILQDTYLEAYRRRDMLMEHPNPAGWLYRTARNLYRNMVRKKENHNFSLETVSQSVFLTEEPRYGSAEWRLAAEGLLPERDRRLLRLYYLDGYSIREIAGTLHATEGSVRVRLLRVRRRVRDLREIG